ncbi:MAG: uroporphyrinogen-III synthase, partial [Burkholderiales bacterium]|nr:uroporphyrinogen-III synthase [Burkholderiales bacterium]
MSLPQIVVTRPIEQAREFVKLAPALAGRTEIFSLLEIHPLENRSCVTEMVARLNEFSLVVFVSPNAINAFLRSVHHWPMAIPIAVMGEGSRKALVANSIFETNAKIFSPRNLLKTDSETLLLELDLTQLSGKKVLIIRGETGRELLADALRSHDIEVVTLPVYRRSAPVFDTFRQQKLRILLQQRNLW